MQIRPEKEHRLTDLPSFSLKTTKKIGIKLFQAGKKMGMVKFIEPIFAGRNIVLHAHLRPLFIYPALVIFQEVFTLVFDLQMPLPFLDKNRDGGMGKIPSNILKFYFRPRSVYL